MMLSFDCRNRNMSRQSQYINSDIVSARVLNTPESAYQDLSHPITIVFRVEVWLIDKYRYLNKKMLSLLVPSGYAGGNITEKIQNPRLIVGYVFFSAMIITRMIRQREHFIVYVIKIH